jgi:pSer/pThr/pTyr-binding forkhead associated (FHA) protein
MERAAFLILVNVSEEDWSYKVDEQIKIIGRSVTARIRIPDHFQQVSRRHAEVWREKDRNWVRDVGSIGGTFVNGICVEKGQTVNLTIGDRLTLSDVKLKVVGEVSKLAELMVEAGIAVLASSTEEATSKTDITRVLPPDFVRDMLRRLTPAELDVVLWMYRGYTNDEELGRTLHRSPNTVHTQVGSIFEKLNLHSPAEIVSWLKRAGGSSGSVKRVDHPTSLEITAVKPHVSRREKKGE